MNRNQLIIALPVINKNSGVSSDASQTGNDRRKWIEALESLICKQQICGICLSRKDDLRSLDHIYDKEHVILDNDCTLRSIITSTFGSHIQELPSKYLCKECTNSVLQAYFLVQQINNNHETLLTCLEKMEQQISSMDIVKKEKIKSEMQPNIEKTYEKPIIDNKIICPLCNRMLKFKLYNKHYKNKHSKEKLFKCSLCMNILFDLQLLIEHRKVEHNEIVCKICYTIINVSLDEHIEMYHVDKIFKCDMCAMHFDNAGKLEKHISKHVSSNIVCQHCLNIFTNVTFKLHQCIYKCTECINSCIHEDVLLFYRDQHTSGKTVFNCQDCEYVYKDINEIIAHANEAHLSHYPHICKNCGEKFASIEILEEHIQSTHKEIEVKTTEVKRAYKCDICELRFKFQENLVTHRKSHMKCQYCNKYFKLRGVLNHHIKEFHKINLIRVYKCTMCPEDYRSRKKYLEHLKTHSKKSRHICRQCGASFLSKNKHLHHVSKHALLKDVECTVCHKLFNKYAIKRHYMLVHEKTSIKKPIESNKCVCDECGKMLASQAALERHRIIHKPMRVCPYCCETVNGSQYKIHAHTCKSRVKGKRLKLVKCSYCDYTTSDKVCLTAHTNRYHLKVRPYQCEVCHKSFFSALTLKDHVKTHFGEKPEHCELCGNRFASRKALMLHTRLHTGEKPYACDLCDEKFLSSSRRTAHRIRKHFEPSIQCDFCPSKWYTNTCLRRHVEKCHLGNKIKKSVDV